MIGPVEIIGQEMERVGIRKPDWALAFMWGYLLGAAKHEQPGLLHDEERLRQWCRMTFVGRRNQNGTLRASERRRLGL